MRISRLNLVKYGHFDGTPIELPAREVDVHIIYGDNEAGKSTTLAALEDLLFGFPKSTPYSFRFPPPKLRIGALLESSDSAFQFLRRKGNKDTVVDEDGKAIQSGEKQLAAMLQGVDRAFFQRMFFLNHQRLRAGSEDLLTVGEDAGETLLASGAGIQGLAEVLRKYDADADTLWAKTSSQKRAFTQSLNRLRAAKAAERDASVNVTEYRARKNALEEATVACEKARENVQEQQAHLHKLQRIRRVYRNVMSLIEIQELIDKLGQVIELPADAAEQLDTADRKLQTLASRRTVYEERIKKLQSDVDNLHVDEQLLQRRVDIETLAETRVKVQDGRDDLPRRHEDLSALEQMIADQLRELGWKLDKDQKPRDLLPSGPVVTKARNQVAKLGNVAATLQATQDNLATMQRTIRRLRKDAPQNDASRDPTGLRAANAAAQNENTVVGARETAEQQHDRASAGVTQILVGLVPPVSDVETLRSMVVPSTEAIESHREAALSWKSKLESIEDELHKASQTLVENQATAKKYRDSGGLLTDTDLHTLRERRDAAWGLLADKYLDGRTVESAGWRACFGDHDHGRSVYEALVAGADKGADDRFAHAEAVARLNDLDERVEAEEQRIVSLTGDLNRLRARQEVFDADWASFWSESGIKAESPDRMLIWSRLRQECLAKQADVDNANVVIAQFRAKESSLIEALVCEIEALGTEIKLPSDPSLAQAIALAKELDTKLKDAREASRQHDKALREALEEEANQSSAVDSARAALNDWNARWTEILKELGLDTSTRPDDVESYLSLIESVRQNIDKANELRLNRIEKIERDIRSFEDRTKSLVAAVADDLSDKFSDDAVFALVARLREAEANRDKRSEAQSDIENDAAKLESFANDEREFNDVIAGLHSQASTETIKDLRSAIKRSDELRRCSEQRATITSALEADGDGLPVAELKAEVEGVNLDDVTAEAQALDGDVKALNDGVLPLRDQMREAQTAFDSIGTSGDAAIAASRIQSAYADMDRIAASFVRARTAERLLRWGIDYFRRQKLGPLLDKASKLFTLVTGGRYQRLVVEYDEDTPVLAGIDADNTVKETAAMSEGTRDQLYLALRLAAVEDYIERSAPMPFVADDIFINFDETRTKHAMHALCELGRRCQVVVFTHHTHVVEIAKSVLSSSSSVVTLT